MSFEKPSGRFQFKIFFLILLTIFSINGAFAQGTSSITGVVKDQNEAVVSGVTVLASSKGSGSEITTVTDANGKFEFKNLPTGQYIIKVRKSGFSENAQSISLDGGESAVQDFSIDLGGLREEVTVTAAKGLRSTAEIPQTVTSVGEEEIEQRRPVGIGEAYERSPSVLSTDTNPFRARPQIRGLQSNRLLVTVDGERLNDPRFGQDSVGVSPALIDTSQIKQVEVVAGSGSSLYGSDAIGGSINIITKGPDRSLDGPRFDLKFTGDYGSNNNYRKGTVALGLGSKLAAVRLNVGRFIQPNYKIGSQGITRQEVIRSGNFAAAAGNLAGQPLVSSYPIYELNPGQEIGNSQARGYLSSLDFMVFPSDTQIFRIRFNANPYRDLGVPFTETPFSTSRPNTGVSNYYKLSLRYEKREIADWFPRVSASYYNQDYQRILEETRYTIRNGSSYTGSTFTGNLSTFARTGETRTSQHANAFGYDVQFNFIPFKNSILITGVNYSNNFSRDNFDSTTFNANSGLVTQTILGVANTPRSRYKNLGWYNQFEYTPIKYFRIAGGVRWDKWQTSAEPTRGYPSGVLGEVFLRTLPLIRANPGALDAVGAAGYTTLASGQTINTESKVATYNIGATGFIPGGFNPYVRFSTSFREPDILNRYLFRNFTSSPFFSLPSIINTNLKPEKGKDIDFGLKIARDKIHGAISYYRNQINNASNTATGVYCANISSPPVTGYGNGAPGTLVADTPPGFGCPPGPPTHLVQIFQTVNVNKVTIRGFEAQAEIDIPLGDFGSLTPFATFSTIKANQTGDTNRRAIVQNLYNSNAPLKLEGSVNDIPFYSLPNYQGAFAPRFTSAKGNWWAEYEYRFTSKVTRVDPNDISFAGITTHGYFAAYKGLRKQTIRGGFKFGETMPTTVTMGIENLTNNTYFQLFQPAPGAGRSFTIGISFGRSGKLNL
jgi:outer membrane receptor protein involved in Fe transport